MVMVLSLNLTAFAATDTDASVLGSLEQEPVSKTIVVECEETSYEQLYCVNIKWEDFNVSYQEIKSDWNVDTLRFDETNIEWTGEPTITITNKSSVAVYADLLYKAPDHTNVYVNWDIESFGAGSDSNAVFKEATTANTEFITFWMASKADVGYETEDVPFVKFTGTLNGDLGNAITNSSIELGTVSVDIY